MALHVVAHTAVNEVTDAIQTLTQEVEQAETVADALALHEELEAIIELADLVSRWALTKAERLCDR